MNCLSCIDLIEEMTLEFVFIRWIHLSLQGNLRCCGSQCKISAAEGRQSATFSICSSYLDRDGQRSSYPEEDGQLHSQYVLAPEDINSWRELVSSAVLVNIQKNTDRRTILKRNRLTTRITVNLKSGSQLSHSNALYWNDSLAVSSILGTPRRPVVLQWWWMTSSGLLLAPFTFPSMLVPF